MWTQNFSPERQELSPVIATKLSRILSVSSLLIFFHYLRADAWEKKLYSDKLNSQNVTYFLCDFQLHSWVP